MSAASSTWLPDVRCQPWVAVSCQMSDASCLSFRSSNILVESALNWEASYFIHQLGLESALNWEACYWVCRHEVAMRFGAMWKNGSGSTRALSAKFKSLAVLSLCVSAKALMQTWLLMGHVCKLFATDSGYIRLYAFEDWSHLHGCPLLHLCQEAAQVKSLEPSDWRWLTDIAPPLCLLRASVTVLVEQRQSPSRMKGSTAAFFCLIIPWWLMVHCCKTRRSHRHRKANFKTSRSSDTRREVKPESKQGVGWGLGSSCNQGKFAISRKNVAHESSSKSFSKDSCMSCVGQSSSVCNN